MVRKNKLENSKMTDVFTVEHDKEVGVFKLVRSNIGGRWISKFSYDIEDLAKFIKEKDIFISNYKHYMKLLNEKEQ